MRSSRLILPALIAIALAAPIVRAQDASIRVGTCNFIKVLEQMDERKAIEEQNKNQQERIRVEISRHQNNIKQLTDRRSGLKPDSQVYREASQELLKAEMDYRIWVELTQREQTRTEKEQLKMLFDHIRDGVKEVAEARKLDLVLADRRPDLTVTSQDERVAINDFKQLIAQTDVLYGNEKADVTQAVVAAVNKKYAAGAAAPATPPSK